MKMQVGSSYNNPVEARTTKALIHLLEFAKRVNFPPLLTDFLRLIKVPRKEIISFKLQKLGKDSRPSGIINLSESKVIIETMVNCCASKDYAVRHRKSLAENDFLLLITNAKNDRLKLKKFGDNRLRHVSWRDIHQMCLNLVYERRGSKKLAAILAALNDFIDYLEKKVVIRRELDN